MEHDWAKWGKLSDRYKQAKPRKILSLDGGGIRGLMTVKALQKIEKMVKEHTGKERLCDYFDYIGGTSTGAIIAAALSVGMTTQQVLKFYQEFGEKAFTKSSLLKRWKSFYGKGELVKKLQSEFGADRTLHPQGLENLLLMVTRNATTDSAWPISTNPSAKYNDTARDDCNLDLPLWKIVRASTAAPAYFPPEVIDLNGTNEFVFVDGGTTAYNNPAFLMYRMATAPEYKLGWQKGEDKLLIVSVGTGSMPEFGKTADDPESSILYDVQNTLAALMSQAAFDQDVNCRATGRCTYGPLIDREVGDMVPKDDNGDLIPLTTPLGRDFLYARYNVELTRDGLDELGLHDIKVNDVTQLDAVEHMDKFEKVGVALARLVKPEHFGPFISGV